MGIIARQGLINTLIIYSGFTLGYINVALLMPKFMETGEIGARETIVSFALILSQFGLFGLHGGFTKFFYKYRKLSKHGLLESFIILTTSIFLITLVLFQPISSYFLSSFEISSPNTFEHFRLIYLLGLFFVILSITEAYFRNMLLSQIPMFLREFFQRFLTTILILLFAFDIINFNQFITLFCLTYALIIILMLSYLVINNHIKLRFSFKMVRLIDFKELFNFASFGLITSTASMFVIQIDKIMLSSGISEQTTGIYTLGVYLATLIEAPKRAISQTSTPLIAKAWGRNDLKEVGQLLKSTAIGQQFIGSLLFILLWCSIDNIYEIIPKEEIFSTGKWVVLFIGISKALTMAFGSTNEVLSYSPRYRSNLIFSILTLALTITCNLILIPEYGLNGAAIASLITLTLLFASKAIFNYFFFKMSCFDKKNIIALIISALVLTSGVYLPDLKSPYYNIVYKSTFITAVYLISFYCFRISPEFNGAVHKYLLRKK